MTGLFARNAAAQYYPFNYLEAECPDTAQGGYVTKQTSITGFSGPGYLRSAGNTTAATYNNTSTDHATFTFSTNHFDYFQIHYRVNTNNSANDDSFFFLIDPANYPNWNSVTNIPAGSGWRWIQGGIFALPVGAHTLEIANREDGLNIDKIAIIPYSLPAPSGGNQPTFNCPVPLYFETECRTGAFAEYQIDKSSKSGFSGTGYIESKTTSTSSSPRVDEATYYFETGASAYNFFFRINTSANGSSDSWFYQVDNGSWVTMNNTSGLGSGWRWAQGTGSVTLSRGKHTFRIRNRESNLAIDRIAFVPTSATGPSGTAIGGNTVNCEPFQTMSDWGPGEVNEFYNTHVNYFAAVGAEMLDMHIDWHNTNGIGGQQGLGSGVGFLGFHRAMMNDLRSFALETNSRSWLPIAVVGRSIPPTLQDSWQALLAVNRETDYSARLDSAVMDFGVPNFLVVGGAGIGPWPAQAGVAPNVYSKLEEIVSLDDLGRVIGTNYHNYFHSRVGGTMSDPAISPSDPIFYGWHGYLDKIVTTWLNTTKGKQWAALPVNANHPFLKDGFTNMDGWNTTDWD